MGCCCPTAWKRGKLDAYTPLDGRAGDALPLPRARPRRTDPVASDGTAASVRDVFGVYVGYHWRATLFAALACVELAERVAGAPTPNIPAVLVAQLRVRSAAEKPPAPGSAAERRAKLKEMEQAYLSVYESPTLVSGICRFLRGGSVVELHGRSGSPKDQKVRVSIGGQKAIVWTDPDGTNTGSVNDFPFAEVGEIRLGPYSDVFQRHPIQVSDKRFFRSFSVHIKRGSRTIDVVAATTVDFEAWVIGLCAICHVGAMWSKPLEFAPNDPLRRQLSASELAVCATNNVPLETFVAMRALVEQRRDDALLEAPLFEASPNIDANGAVRMSRGELRYVATPHELDIFRTCALWDHFRDARLVFDDKPGIDGIPVAAWRRP